jgi:hypothetical protein
MKLWCFDSRVHSPLGEPSQSKEVLHMHEKHSPVFITIAFFITVTSLIALPVTSAQATETSAICTKIPASLVKADVGGTPTNANASTGSDGFFGYPEQTITCTYSTGINLTFSTPATAASFSKAQNTLSHATSPASVAGIGSGAFSGIGNNTVCSGTGTQKCTQFKTTKLWFYVANKSFVTIAVDNGKLPGLEKLAKAIIPKL